MKLLFYFYSVASKSDKNLMTISNLGVCFGPTLLRPEEETVASIMDLKFYNIVVEILIEHYEKIFNTEPDKMTTTIEKQQQQQQQHSPRAVSIPNSFNTSGMRNNSVMNLLSNDQLTMTMGGYDGSNVIYGSNNMGNYNNSSGNNYKNYSQPYTCVSIFFPNS